MQKLFSVMLVALSAWMLYWAYDLTESNDQLVIDYMSIANEFRRFDPPKDLDPSVAAQVAEQIYDQQKQSAQFSRDNLGFARENVEIAETMLVTVSSWAFAVIILLGTVVAMRRYRFKLERRSGTEDVPDVATV